MPSGGYDNPHMSSSFPRYEQRRLAGSASTNYDRHDIVTRSTSPTPGPSRRPYDSYVPLRSDTSFRDNSAPMPHRGNNYRPGYSNNYNSRSPSPEPYVRAPESDQWNRPTTWRPRTSSGSSDRKPMPPSPSTSIGARGWGPRGRRPENHHFDPPDLRRTTHPDRLPRINPPPPSSNRFPDRNAGGPYDRSPERSGRHERGVKISGDRFRAPPPRRDSFNAARSPAYDSYRPAHQAELSTSPRLPDWNASTRPGGWSPPRHGRTSSTGSYHRRDSGSLGLPWSIEQREPPSFPISGVPRKSSISSMPSVSPFPSPKSDPWHTSEPYTQSWTYPSDAEAPQRNDPPSRPFSRSSIASTHVSDSKPDASEYQPKYPNTNVLESLNKSLEIYNRRPSFPPNPYLSDDKLYVPFEQPMERAESAPKTQQYEPAVSQSPLPEPEKKHQELEQSMSMDVDSPIQAVSAIVPKSAVIDTVVTPKSSTPPKSHSPPRLPLVDTSLNQISTSPTSAGSDQPMEMDTPSTPASLHALPSPSLSHFIPSQEEIPPLTEAKTKRDALRTVVMTRLRRDHQTREARVEPVLQANSAIKPVAEVGIVPTPDSLLEELCTGEHMKNRMDSFAATRPQLAKYLEQRSAIIEEKTIRLKDEFITKQDSWLAHCQSLNDQQKTLATEHEMQHTGRTTRRSTAITDAVRSDFEMEQIIASLGNDDATDPNHLSLRNLATIPDMISVVNGQIDYVFDDTNHRVNNPAEYYAPHTGIHDWTPEEKQIFSDKYARFPKQFGIIADFLPNKTAAQCVDYYYLHKKNHVDFRKVILQFGPNKRRRRGMGKKKGNGLLADIAMHDAEVNRGGMGTPVQSSTPASAPVRAPRGRKSITAAAAVTVSASASESKKPTSVARRSAVQFEDTPTSTPTPEPESRPRRRKGGSANATSSSSVTPAALPTSRTVEQTPVSTPTVQTPPPPSPPPIVVEDPEPSEPEPEARPAKRMKRTRKIKSSAIVVDEPGSPQREMAPATKEVPARKVKWSERDKKKLIQMHELHGRDYDEIASHFPGRTGAQVKAIFAEDPTLRVTLLTSSMSRKNAKPPVAKTEVPAKKVTDRRHGQDSEKAGSPTSAQASSSKPSERESGRRLSDSLPPELPPPPWMTPPSPKGPAKPIPRYSLNSERRHSSNHNSDDMVAGPSNQPDVQDRGGKSSPRRNSYPHPNDPIPHRAVIRSPDGMEYPLHPLSPRHSQHYPSASYTTSPPPFTNGRPPPLAGPYGRSSTGPTPPSQQRPPYTYPPYMVTSPNMPPYPPARSFMPDDSPYMAPSRQPSTVENSTPAFNKVVKKENPYPVFDDGGGIDSGAPTTPNASSNLAGAETPPYNYSYAVWSP